MSAEEVAAARERLEQTIEVFRRAAARAIDVAADRRSYPMVVTETRHQATFALAAVGAALKAALKAGRPDDPASEGPPSGRGGPGTRPPG